MKSKIEDKELWKIIESLIKKISISECKEIIINILFLKYSNIQFKKAKKKLEEDGLTFEMINNNYVLFYNQYNSLIIKEKSSWNYIIKFLNSYNIGKILNDAFLELEKSNPILFGIFNKNFNNEQIDQIKLSGIISFFSNFDFLENENINDVFYNFLNIFIKKYGRKKTEFFTSRSILKLMINLVKPIKGTIYDPECNLGQVFVECKNYIKKNNFDINNISFYGQESNLFFWKFAKLNLILNNIFLENINKKCILGEKSCDVFLNDEHLNIKFDFIISSIPFNLKNWWNNNLVNDYRWKEFGIPNKEKTNFAYILHIINKLKKNGKAIFHISSASLTTRKEFEIRKKILNKNIIDLIIELPKTLGSIWILNKNKKNNNILLISEFFFKNIDKLKFNFNISEKEILKLNSYYEKYLSNQNINIEKIIKVINLDKIEKKFFNISTNFYINFFNKEKKINENELKNKYIEIKNICSNFEIEKNKLLKLINEKLKNEN